MMGRNTLMRAVVGIALVLGLMLRPAWADNHGLIMWIGQYANPAANLPGIELDAANARKIALAMGVPERNLTEVSNAQLSQQGIGAALDALAARIGQDDKVFIYYSGHGTQLDNAAAGGKKCSEGIVAQDLQTFLDRDLEASLARLSAKASQVVMLNDSCFSGGAAEKSLDGLRGGLVAKALPRGINTAKATATATSQASPQNDERQCGEAVNKWFGTKNLEVVRRSGANLLYIAAAADNEVAFATPNGSQATVAWAACLADPVAADLDHSGSVDGEELRACAQAQIDRNGKHRQTVTLVGSGSKLPVAFAAAKDGSGAVAVNGARTLDDLHAAADVSYQVTLMPVANTLHIGRDFIDFTVETNREGYLYVLQVGSDGKTFNLLFPNQLDPDNWTGSGKHRFPREAWRLRSGGPAGTSYLMALVSPVPKDFSALMGRDGPFASAPTTREGTKNLVVVATGSAGGSGRYGASPVVAVTEAP